MFALKMTNHKFVTVVLVLLAIPCLTYGQESTGEFIGCESSLAKP